MSRSNSMLVSIGDLLLAVVFALVGEPRRAMFDEPLGDSVHLGLRAETALSDHGGSLALNEGEDILQRQRMPASFARMLAFESLSVGCESFCHA